MVVHPCQEAVTCAARLSQPSSVQLLYKGRGEATSTSRLTPFALCRWFQTFSDTVFLDIGWVSQLWRSHHSLAGLSGLGVCVRCGLNNRVDRQAILNAHFCLSAAVSFLLGGSTLFIYCGATQILLAAWANRSLDESPKRRASANQQLLGPTMQS